MKTSIALITTLLAGALAQPVTWTRRQDVTWPEANATPRQSQTPQEWIDAYLAAKGQGKIPGFAPSLNRDGPLAYPSGTDAGAASVCSWSYNQCQGPNDIHNAPAGQLGVNFDDGPSQGTSELEDFLESNNQSATRFLIGSAIVNNLDEFHRIAANPLNQLAVHTWSHPPFISALSDLDIVAELGWTMQIIYNFSGKIPAYWRAPQGDLDNRVRAIAENVFGLTAVSWSADSSDWMLYMGSGGEGGTNFDIICNNIKQAFDSMGSNGVLLLEHELTDQSVHAFKQCTWPLLHQHNLDPRPIAELGNGADWYANAANNTTPVTAQTMITSRHKVDLQPEVASSSAVPPAVTMAATAPVIIQSLPPPTTQSAQALSTSKQAATSAAPARITPALSLAAIALASLSLLL